MCCSRRDHGSAVPDLSADLALAGLTIALPFSCCGERTNALGAAGIVLALLRCRCSISLRPGFERHLTEH